MEYRIGQRVRMLHDSGEGVITALIDKHHVEVDWGDDFPIDVHVSEIIAIDSNEIKYVGAELEAGESDHRGERIQTMGATLFELSLAIVPVGEDRYEISLINPEPVDILFTSYQKQRNKYYGIAHGQLASGAFHRLIELNEAGISQTRAFYFQVQAYVHGKGHPHSPWDHEIPIRKEMMMEKPRDIRALDRKGWIISLREDLQVKDIESIEDSEFVRIRKADTPVVRGEHIVDLHIEELVPNPQGLAPSEMLRLQMQQLDTTLARALAEEWKSLTIIHGVGTGALKKAVREKLRQTAHVKSFASADPGKYGNGATQVAFR